ncbi:MAG: DUF2066 domain-containing protein [Rhodospirillales bacterium]|nr:DUF2066 domain-containing protein [Rhodospirillales bacterium]
MPVDATAETAAAARIRAVAEGQRRGLRIVFERLALAEDLSKLPRPNDRQIDALVQAFEVDKERTSAVRYLAELTVRFKPDDMRALLQQAGVRFAETASRPVVVLPVVQAPKPAAANAPPPPAPVLWHEDNQWRRVWAEQPGNLGLVPLIVPIGDLADGEAIDAAGALAGDPAKLAQIAQRYRAGEVIVSVLTRSEDPRSKATVLQVSATRHRIGGNTDVVIPETRPVSVPATGNVEERMAAFAREQIRTIEDQWKRSHILRFDQEQRLGMVLPLAALEDLVEARRRLAEVSGVRRVEVTAISRKQARLSVVYSGDPEQLRLAAQQKELMLSTGASEWQLRLGTPATLPASTSPATAPQASGAAARPR